MEISCERVADPELRDPGDVIVKVTVAGLCGLDLHPYRGREVGLDRGTIMGHEFVGEVVDARGTDRVSVGDRVVAPFTTSCGGCYYCRIGLTARCERGQLFGWVERGQGLHGGQADYVRVPLADASLVRVPDGVSDDHALLAGDILATGMFAAELGGVFPKNHVAVLGCGPVGLMAIIAALDRGAARVFAVDVVSERVALAAQLGATSVLNRDGEALAQVREATDGRGVDAVLEVVGSPDASRLALDLVRPGGAIAAVGVHTEPQFAFSPGEAYDKNLTYRAGRCPARHYMEPALALLASGQHDVMAIVTHRLPLDQGVRAYEMFDRKQDGCVKVLLAP